MSPGLRVLVVDDDEAVRDVLALLLEDLGHVPTTAHSARAALALLDDGLTIDLVLTDHRMRGMTGIELATEVRRRWPGLQLVLTSGNADSLEVPPGLFATVLAKPVTVPTLAATLTALEHPS